MSESVQKPRIRFKGFSDAWEQRKFEDLYSYASEGGTPDTNNFSFYKDGTIPFVKIEDTENKYIDSTKSHISVEGLNHSSAWLIPAHNILFTNGATVGNVAINRIPVATKQGILGIIPSKQVTVELMFYLLSSTLFQREVKSRMATGTFATIILKNLNQIPVCIPTNKNEQNLITDYLSQLDNLITLHQRKYDKLVAVKKALLEKMFPADGETVPKIRFKGFSDAWEQRKLGDIVDVRSGKDYKHLSEGNIPVYGTGGYMLSVNQALSYDEDAIGIGRKGTIDKPYILKAPFWTVDTLFYAIPREKVDLNFAFDIFQNIDWKKKDESTGVPSLSKTAINEIDISAPCLEEQQAIGSYFSKIDNLITLHQRQLEKLKNIKSALLEKMFV